MKKEKGRNIFKKTMAKNHPELMKKLPDFDSRIKKKKKDASMTDLAALTAATGDEFAMFTKGRERLIIRGNSARLNVDTTQASELAALGY